MFAEGGIRIHTRNWEPKTHDRTYSGMGSFSKETGVSDAALWQRVIERESGAFDALFERHADTVYNHCFRRTASWSTAEDLTSIVWFETWRRREDVRFYDDSMLPWLLATANNCLSNFNRSKRRHQRMLARLPPNLPPLDFGEETSQRLDDEQSMAQLLAATAKLRSEEQEAIALCDWSGLSHEAAAQALGTPVGTVKSRLFRAHEHLRAAVNYVEDGHWIEPRVVVQICEETKEQL